MRTTAFLAALALPLLIAGCGATGGSASPTVTVTETVTAGAENSSEDTTPSSEPSAESTPDGAQVTFGQTYTYTDGLAITVSKPAAYKPSQYSICTKAKRYAVFTMTLKNGTGKAFDPSMFHQTVQSGSAEADSCYDSAQDIGGSPDTKVLNGRTVVWKVAYGVANPADIVMEVTPSFDYESVIYAN